MSGGVGGHLCIRNGKLIEFINSTVDTSESLVHTFAFTIEPHRSPAASKTGGLRYIYI